MNSKVILLLPVLFFLISCNEKVPVMPHINSPDIVLHKGLHMHGKLAPENSLDAIALAGRVGANFIELDTYVTKDGQIVLMHDLAINKLLRHSSDYSPVEGENIYIDEITFEELRSRYVLTADNQAMRRPVPTLEEGLKLCRHLGIYPYIEIKESYFKKGDVKKVYDIAMGILGKGNFSITCFDTWVLEYLRDMDGELNLYRDVVQDINFFLDNKINYYPDYTNIKEDNIAAVHKAGLQASTWTVPKEAFDTILTKGFDGILSDDIAPMFKKEYAVFNDNSDGNFNSYITDGLLEDNVLKLEKGQLVELKETISDSLYLGGIYFAVEAKGKFEIEANGFRVERENLHDDYQIYRFQYLFHNEKPYFKIISSKDNTNIKSVWLAICNY